MPLSVRWVRAPEDADERLDTPIPPAHYDIVLGTPDGPGNRYRLHRQRDADIVPIVTVYMDVVDDSDSVWLWVRAKGRMRQMMDDNLHGLVDRGFRVERLDKADRTRLKRG